MAVTKAMLCQTVLILAILCIGRQQVVFSACSEYWAEFNGYCYAEYAKKVHWFDAQTLCRYIGGDIVTIHSPGENDFIRKNVGFDYAWIGLNRLEKGAFNWNDNTSLNYVNFRTRFSHMDSSVLCLVMHYDGRWLVKDCRESYSFICKRMSNNSVSTPTPTPTTKAVKVEGCPPNFDSVPGASQCYHVGGKNSSEYKNFTEAIDACHALQPGATLASMHSGIDQRFVITLLDSVSSDTLIGLNNKHSTHYGEFLSEWADKREVNKVYWSKYQPDPYIGNSKAKCVYMEKKIQTAGRWSIGSCDVRRPYVCGHPKDPKFPVKIRHNKGCPTGFQKFRNSCYKFFTDKRTLSDAEATCVKQNGHIVSFHDKYETAFVELLIDNVNQAWIGLSYKKANEEYCWLDGWPIIFTDWGSKKVYPDMCAIDIFDEGWQTVSCDTKQPFVCEIDYDPIPPTTTVNVSCPDSWILFQENCYRLETDFTISWPDAARHCSNVYMGTLTSIHSPEESAFINNLLTMYGYNDAWIGLDRGRSGNAFWLDFSTLEYIDWASNAENHIWEIHGEKKPFLLTEYCVATSHIHHGKWVKSECLKNKHFICKLPQDLLIKVTSQPSSRPTASVTPNLTGHSTHSPPSTGHFTSSPRSVSHQTISHSTHTSPSVAQTSLGDPTSSSSSVSSTKVGHPSSKPPVSTSSSHITSVTPKQTGHSTHSTPSVGHLTRSAQSVSHRTVSHITNEAAGKTENNGSRLSAGNEAGIALGSIAFVTLVVVLAVLTRKYYSKWRRNNDPAATSLYLNHFNGNDSSM